MQDVRSRPTGVRFLLASRPASKASKRILLVLMHEIAPVVSELTLDSGYGHQRPLFRSLRA